MRAVLIIGAFLLAVSAPPLILMAREFAIGSAIAGRYSVERIVSSARGMEGGALQAEIGGHAVELVDDRPLQPDEPFKVNDSREKSVLIVWTMFLALVCLLIYCN